MLKPTPHVSGLSYDVVEIFGHPVLPSTPRGRQLSVRRTSCPCPVVSACLWCLSRSTKCAGKRKMPLGQARNRKAFVMSHNTAEFASGKCTLGMGKAWERVPATSATFPERTTLDLDDCIPYPPSFETQAAVAGWVGGWVGGWLPAGCWLLAAGGCLLAAGGCLLVPYSPSPHGQGKADCESLGFRRDQSS